MSVRYSALPVKLFLLLLLLLLLYLVNGVKGSL